MSFLTSLTPGAGTVAPETSSAASESSTGFLKILKSYLLKNYHIFKFNLKIIDSTNYLGNGSFCSFRTDRYFLLVEILL